MSGQIFKTKKTGNYTTVANEFINDPNLTAKAKGILLYLLSKPDNWTTRTEDIVAHMADGLDSIKSGLKELQQSGYMLRRKIHGERGRFVGWETLVFESPLPKVENPPFGETVGKSSIPPKVENTTIGKSDSGKTRNRKTPQSENPPLLNTELRLNTDCLLKTEEECIFPDSHQPTADPRCANAPTLDEADLPLRTSGQSFEQIEPSSPIQPASSKDRPESSATQEEPGRTESSAAAKKSSPRKKRPPAAEVYAQMSDESKEVYGKVWDWYRGLCAKKSCNPGCKVDGAAAWVRAGIMEEPGKLERFRKGCALYAKSNPVGVPYINRFILGSERHETPYWESAIENAEPIQPAAAEFAPQPKQEKRPSHPMYRIFEATEEEREKLRQEARELQIARGIPVTNIYREA